MSNYDDVTYYRQRLEDFFVWLAHEKIEFATRLPNGMLKPMPSGSVLRTYQDHREMVAATRCSNFNYISISELDEVS